MANGQAVDKLAERHVVSNLATGPKASIRLRLAREIHEKKPQNDNEVSHIDMPIDTTWSHLVAHKNAPRTVWEAFSEARVVLTIRIGNSVHNQVPAGTETLRRLSANRASGNARINHAEVSGRMERLRGAVLEKREFPLHIYTCT
jgi:hypothetical protein